MDFSAGDAYARLIDDQLGEERKLKESLAQRSVVVITSSGVLVAIASSFAALAGTTNVLALASRPRYLLMAALCLFIVAASLGLAINLPYHLVLIDPATLRVGVARHAWLADGVDTLTEAYQLRAELITILRASNRRRARLLMSALVAELGSRTGIRIG